jgi:hypothetical protein
MATVYVNRDGKARLGRRKITFPLSLAGATVTVDDDQDEDDQLEE